MLDRATPHKANILLLAHRVPFPPNRGDRIRTFNLLKFLAQRSDVWLGSLADEPVSAESLSQLDRYCQDVAIFPLGRRRWVRGALSVAGGGSASEGLFYSGRLKRTLRDWCARVHFDAAIVVCSSMARYVRIPELRDTPIILDLVDVDSQKFIDYAGLSAGLKKRLYQLEGQRLRQLETEMGHRADMVTLVSDAEADIYREFTHGIRVEAVGNGVDLDYFHPRPSTADQPDQPEACVFVGALDYQVNVEGVLWFCEHVWPAVHEHRPQAKLWLVGRRPVPAIQHLCSLPGVELAADVPDVRPYYRQAAVSLAPLRFARGIQNKVLESFAMGKAVIGSAQALQGLNVQNHVHAIEANEPKEWFQSIINLFDHPEQRQQLGNSALDLVHTHHRWEASLAPFGEFLGLSE